MDQVAASPVYSGLCVRWCSSTDCGFCFRLGFGNIQRWDENHEDNLRSMRSDLRSNLFCSLSFGIAWEVGICFFPFVMEILVFLFRFIFISAASFASWNGAQVGVFYTIVSLVLTLNGLRFVDYYGSVSLFNGFGTCI